MFDLVRATTRDNLYLHGLLLRGDKNKPAVIHIHGFEGTFYTNEFVRAIAKRLKEKNTTFLTVENRGTAIELELYTTTPGKGKKEGAHFEKLEEARLDIDAWIEFLKKEGYKRIILQGHSLGTMKVVRYLIEGKYKDRVEKLILLAPFDIIYLAEDATKGKWKKYIKVAEQKVGEGKGEEIIPKEFLDVPMSYQTYLSHHNNNDFENVFKFHDKSYNFPILNKINIPVKVIVGTKDKYFNPANISNSQEAIDILKKNIKEFSYKLIENGDHGYNGKEDVVAHEVADFLT